MAYFTGFVFGESLETSERVMRAVFGEHELQLLYRVALEMGHVDRGMGCHGVTNVGQGIDVIRIEDDEDMVDAANMEAQTSQVGSSGGKFIFDL